MPEWHLHHGDALTWLPTVETASIAAVITDPPYNSGGRRRADPLRKYGNHGGRVNGSAARERYSTFPGDTRDQRAYTLWLSLILAECLRATTPGGVLCTFCDWQQIPATADAVQAAGWTWRGVMPWVKPNARPQQGRFRQAAEFIVWGTHGARPLEGPVYPGDFREDAPKISQGRVHLTEKPLGLMRQLVQIAPEGEAVLDPFAGAGTTGHAALVEGRVFLGAEMFAHYHAAAVERLRAVEAAPTLDM